MLATIQAHLQAIEEQEQVRVVYACESGSRAWGFPSQDSDYDVRFIYVRPVDWYLSIDKRRDVIERPITAGLDINGWDLRKALQLFRKSNPPLLEWLGSPIIYLEPYSLAARMRELAGAYYSPAACLYHYLHMARHNFRDYLKGETVWVKKYFYVLRPVLAMIWIEAELGIVPTDFNVLVARLVTEPGLRVEIDRLLAAKRAGLELGRGPRVEVISQFLEREIARWDMPTVPPFQPPAFTDRLDALFRAGLAEVWGARS